MCTDCGTSACGCCAGTSAETPGRITNRPGLRQIAYRFGRHAAFKHTMLAAISASTNQRLRRLLSREDDDWSVALIDAWATTLDVLSFYQERTANEHYLRTASERVSLLYLARAIGYELRPGLAAETALAFAMEETPGAPAEAPIPVGTKVQSIPGPGEQAQTFETTEPITGRPAWNSIRPRQAAPQTLSASAATLWVAASANLRPGDALLIADGAQVALRRVASAERDDANNRTLLRFEPAATGPTALAHAPGAWAMRVKAAPFGHNAPLQTTRDANGNVTDTDEWPLDEQEHVLTLDATHDQIAAGQWLVVDRPASFWMEFEGFGGAFGFGRRGFDLGPLFDTTNRRTHLFGSVETARPSSRAAYGMSGRGTQVRLDFDWTLNDFSLNFARDTVVYAQSEALDLPEAPLAELLPRNNIALAGTYGELLPGQLVAFSGVPYAAPKSPLVSELGEIASVATSAGITTITLAHNLAHDFRRSTASINANVARASQGETSRETLGSADASRTYQRFTLKQTPLTYRSAANASGSATTLEVRVNNLRWREVPTLYGHGPNERIYTTRTSDEGKTTVQFGDGVNGARPPSGTENVRASYRKGSGSGGNLRPGQISMLMSRPLGVRAASNPVASSGGVDAEQRDEARQNAPLTVMTLDRVVSLRDYEDFARAFRGVAKALATWTWDGRQRGVFVTVAGANGASITADSPTFTNLLAAMRGAGDPYVPLRLATFRPAFFRLVARLYTEPDADPAVVEAAARRALLGSFSFAGRAFGEPVVLSVVMAALQSIPGVRAVDLDTLERTDGVGGSGLVPYLPAAQPQAGTAGASAAELLTLDPAGITLYTEPGGAA